MIRNASFVLAAKTILDAGRCCCASKASCYVVSLLCSVGIFLALWNPKPCGLCCCFKSLLLVSPLVQCLNPFGPFKTQNTLWQLVALALVAFGSDPKTHPCSPFALGRPGVACVGTLAHAVTLFLGGFFLVVCLVSRFFHVFSSALGHKNHSLLKTFLPGSFVKRTGFGSPVLHSR